MKHAEKIISLAIDSINKVTDIVHPTGLPTNAPCMQLGEEIELPRFEHIVQVTMFKHGYVNKGDAFPSVVVFVLEGDDEVHVINAWRPGGLWEEIGDENVVTSNLGDEGAEGKLLRDTVYEVAYDITRVLQNQIDDIISENTRRTGMKMNALNKQRSQFQESWHSVKEELHAHEAIHGIDGDQSAVLETHEAVLAGQLNDQVSEERTRASWANKIENDARWYVTLLEDGKVENVHRPTAADNDYQRGVFDLAWRAAYIELAIYFCAAERAQNKTVMTSLRERMDSMIKSGL